MDKSFFFNYPRLCIHHPWRKSILILITMVPVTNRLLNCFKSCLHGMVHLTITGCALFTDVHSRRTCSLKEGKVCTLKQFSWSQIVTKRFAPKQDVVCFQTGSVTVNWDAKDPIYYFIISSGSCLA